MDAWQGEAMLSGVGGEEGGVNQFAVSGECLATDAVLRLTIELDADGAIAVWSHSGIAEVLRGESLYT